MVGEKLYLEKEPDNLISTMDYQTMIVSNIPQNC